MSSEFFLNIPQQQPVPVLEYRLYYDAAGNPLTYTTRPQDGKYIVITREQYARADHNVIVRDGKIVSRRLLQSHSVLELSSTGQKTARYDLNIIPDSDYEDVVHWTVHVRDHNEY